FVPYPYALFFCHEPEGRNVVQEVSLLGADGVKMEAVTSCHMDTKSWTPDVEAFSFLGTKPGSPVCHISPHYDLVWVSGN
ncbi:hypothetical protein, partial [Halostella sp. PRR32]|uniref:hypothetical protein n=1 Tax=Halostella sp. PRR32 TaxID=3098147 RepID=UPI002B1E7DBB